jgi:hypothetical protein
MATFPPEIINKIFSYIQSPINELMKLSIKRYYNKYSQTFQDYRRLGNNANRLSIYYSIRQNIMNEIKFNGFIKYEKTSEIYRTKLIYNDYLNSKYIRNKILLERNILSEYIKQPNKRKKRIGTKAVFIKSQKDYIKRKKQ